MKASRSVNIRNDQKKFFMSGVDAYLVKNVIPVVLILVRLDMILQITNKYGFLL